eukprot:GO256005.1.p1 GENE.GO256005.1~~GO256005.1.p1  ORF type:complete len:146 (-),score=13.29 GO256005.1:141-527(-)
MVRKGNALAVEAKPGGGYEFEMDVLDNKMYRNVEAFLEEFASFKTVRSSTLGREFSSLEILHAEVQRVKDRLAKVNEPKKPDQRESSPKRQVSKSFFDKSLEQESSSDSSSGSDSDSSSSDESGSESE